MIHTVRIDSDHRYWVPDGASERRAPGYSELCNAMGVTRPNPFHTEDGRSQGVALHEWLGFLVRGKEPKTLPDLRIAGRVLGIKKFIRNSGIKLTGGEEPRYDPATGVACTPDLWGHIGHWAYVVDAKRGAKQKSHRLQTACQSIVLRANDFRTQKRAALYLKDNDYRLEQHDDPEDETRWRAIAAGFHAMTPEQRAVFQVAEFPLRDEVFKTLTDAQRRAVINAHAARSWYI
jgi:hypothetical protein